MLVVNRDKVPEREPLTVPEIPIVHASTECFTTPTKIIDLMLDYADIQENHIVLEPSAGTGAIAGYMLGNYPSIKLDVLELDYTLQKVLKDKGYNLRGSDFLTFRETYKYDRVLMNPPFKKLQDIDHVLKAYECLAIGGRLVSVMSPGPFSHCQKKAVAFREWFDSLGGEVVDLPQDSFADSGTGVNSKLLIIDKEK